MELITVKCAWCGTELRLPTWRIKKANRHFCDTRCKGKWQTEHMKGPSSPFYKKESHVLIECDYCGKNFKMRIGQYKRFKKHYCSMECCDDAKRGVPLPERKAELHECTCSTCGKTFTQSKNTKRQKKTCSHECALVLSGKARTRRVSLTCNYCGKKYSVPNCEKGRSKYCSRSCLALAKMVDGHANTLPERLVAEKLDEIGIKYIQQYPIDRMKVDFYIPDTNTVLEVYGDYWHANPQKYPKATMLTRTQKDNIARDRKRRKFLIKAGYKFVYIWESQIKESPEMLKSLLN